MGGHHSHPKEVLEEMVPSTPTQIKRPLGDEWDPRSPSVGIDRTPIHVESTPEHVGDPRSPTQGITRTPIYGGQPGEKFLDVTPLAKLADLLDNDNPSMTTLNSLDGEPVVPLPDLADEEHETLNRSLSEPDLNRDDEAVLIRSRTAPASRSLRESLNVKYRKPKISPKAEVSITPDKNLAKKSESSPRRIPSDCQRSPLAPRNRDMNSPRVIVQKKQANKIARLKEQALGGSSRIFSGNSPAKYKVFSDDKENMDA